MCQLVCWGEAASAQGRGVAERAGFDAGHPFDQCKGPEMGAGGGCAHGPGGEGEGMRRRSQSVSLSLL